MVAERSLRHVKQRKTRAVKGLFRADRFALKRSSLVSVKACQGKVAVCQGVKVLAPDSSELRGTIVSRTYGIHKNYLVYI